MPSLSEVIGKHFDAAVAEAADTGYGKEDVARTMLAFVVQAYRETRPLSEIATELRGVIDNLDPDADYTFMRP
jgi:hypothetical protein